jgi:predicted ATPase
VTFLLTDVEASTRLLHELGDAYAGVLAEHRRLLRAAFHDHNGIEVDTQGDAFFYVFSRASDAVAAAEAGRAALAAGPVRVRMGLHTGEPTLTDEGYVGIDVHKGARIAAAGHGGQILVSEATRDLVDADTVDLGQHRLKDLPAPERIYQLGVGDFAPLKTLYHTNLPIPSTRFLGREHELSEVLELLVQDRVRLLTLTGPGGTGKTRLALQAAGALAEAFPDGVWWVPLASLRDPQLVLPLVGQVLGSRNGLADHIGDRQLLLLIDNFEHLSDAFPLLGELLGECPGLKLLVTSREPLNLSAEREYPVPPFTEEEAVELFRDRAVSSDETEAIRAICLRLDCLPLATELAAARTKALSPEQILERLESRLPLLTGGPRDAPDRQKTLRATIEWSYDLLSPLEQRLFASLAVFVAGCTVAAAEEICVAHLDTLQSLVEKSLVRHSGDRFWMLETIREYAEERFTELPDVEQIRMRHAHLYNGLASASGAELVGPASGEMVDLLDREHPNIRVAFEWALANGKQEEALAGFAGVWRYLERRGHMSEAMRWFDQLSTAMGSSPQVRLEALRGAALFTQHLGQLSRTQALAEEMLSLARTADDVRMTGIAVAILGTTALFVGELESGRARLEEARLTLREAGDEEALGRVLNSLSYAAAAGGDCSAASTYAHESLAFAEQVGDDVGKTLALSNLGLANLLDGRDADAEAQYVDCLIHADKIGFGDSVSYAYEGLAAVAVRRGNGERAARLLGASEAIRDATKMHLDVVEQQIHDDVTQAIRDLLSAERLAEEWEAGREAAHAEAVAFATATDA